MKNGHDNKKELNYRQDSIGFSCSKNRAVKMVDIIVYLKHSLFEQITVPK